MTALEIIPTTADSDTDDEPIHLGCCVADRALCGIVLSGALVPDSDPRPVCSPCHAAERRGEGACVFGRCPDE